MDTDSGRESGGTAAEYAILLSLIAGVIVAAVVGLGSTVFSSIEAAGDGLAQAQEAIGGGSDTDPDGGGTAIDPGSVSFEASPIENPDGSWSASVTVTVPAPDGAIVSISWATNTGATGATTCVVVAGVCSVNPGPFPDDADEAEVLVDAVGGTTDLGLSKKVTRTSP